MDIPDWVLIVAGTLAWFGCSGTIWAVLAKRKPPRTEDEDILLFFTSLAWPSVVVAWMFGLIVETALLANLWLSVLRKRMEKEAERLSVPVETVETRGGGR